MSTMTTKNKASRKMRPYVGMKNGVREVFYSNGDPTAETHGATYNAVTGPFVTSKAAELMVESPGRFTSVADAERTARTLRASEQFMATPVNSSEPKRSDYPNTIEGFETFSYAHNEWKHNRLGPAASERLQSLLAESKPLLDEQSRLALLVREETILPAQQTRLKEVNDKLSRIKYEIDTIEAPVSATMASPKGRALQMQDQVKGATGGNVNLMATPSNFTQWSKAPKDKFGDFSQAIAWQKEEAAKFKERLLAAGIPAKAIGQNDFDASLKPRIILQLPYGTPGLPKKDRVRGYATWNEHTVEAAIKWWNKYYQGGYNTSGKPDSNEPTAMASIVGPKVPLSRQGPTGRATDAERYITRQVKKIVMAQNRLIDGMGRLLDAAEAKGWDPKAQDFEKYSPSMAKKFDELERKRKELGEKRDRLEKARPNKRALNAEYDAYLGEVAKEGAGTNAIRDRMAGSNTMATPVNSIVGAIRHGDRVTIVDRFGKEHTGRAVMHSKDGGWVLNMGGAHGTPGLADESNIVKVKQMHAPAGLAVMGTPKNATFEMNGKKYSADEETVSLLRGIVPGAKSSKDASAVAAVMELGLKSGRITEVGGGGVKVTVSKPTKARRSGRRGAARSMVTPILNTHKKPASGLRAGSGGVSSAPAAPGNFVTRREGQLFHTRERGGSVEMLHRRSIKNRRSC